MANTVTTAEILKQHSRFPGDTGSPEVQIALLTSRINSLTEHLQTHELDNHSRRGLLKMVSKRRKLLDYLSKSIPEAYTKLITQLGLRR